MIEIVAHEIDDAVIVLSNDSRGEVVRELAKLALDRMVSALP